MDVKVMKWIANILPPTVVVWVIVRAFAHTTTHECSDKTPDEVGYSDLFKSWNKLSRAKHLPN